VRHDNVNAEWTGNVGAGAVDVPAAA
jgi:hypothetical protein